MKPSTKLLSLISLIFLSCTQSTGTQNPDSTPTINTAEKAIINDQGQTIQTRFNPPPDFKRTEIEANTFANYLRQLPLKPSGTKVKYFNGDTKHLDVYAAVVEMEISNRDLQQCADAIMRLKGEYLYSTKAYDKISFNLTNGFKMDGRKPACSGGK